MFGKTGTTNDQKDSWFIGGTPYALAGIWTGYRDTPTAMNNTETKYAISIWQGIMSQYLENKEPLEFTYDENVVSATFCQQSGKLATGRLSQNGTGWYKKDEMPEDVIWNILLREMKPRQQGKRGDTGGNNADGPRNFLTGDRTTNGFQRARGNGTRAGDSFPAISGSIPGAGREYGQ